MKQDTSTWFITGCSTGLGRHLAQTALARGFNVVVTARDPERVQDIVAASPGSALALPLDVTEPAQISYAVRLAEERFGGIDVLINNAGYGYRSAIEEGAPEDVQKLFATNVFGLVAMTRAVLPGMRSRRKGCIVNISSIAGRMALPGSGYYSATKFAVAGISDALRKEVAPLGIRVMLVEPGAFRTDFSGRSLQQSPLRIADYDETAGRRRKENDSSDGHQAGDPARGAHAIIDTVTAGIMPFRLLLGSDAISIIQAGLDEQQRELDAWKAISLGTDFPPAH
jgi:NAD(P)-dependent dehydrogenase (short-subunit alcohol dehydrogenase family)